MNAIFKLSIGIFFALLAPAGAIAAETVVEEHLVLVDHKFQPEELTIPANQKIKLIITNKDASSAEFESGDLNREKVVPANGEIYVTLGPLDPGVYRFVDDFHRDAASGKLIAQ